MSSEFPYPALQVEKKSGTEPFHFNGKAHPFDIRSFWQWEASNLAANNLRGHLAEYLVAHDLGVSDGVRREWDDYDVLTPSGIKVEIKSASYIQSWRQAKLSKILFSVAPSTAWDYERQCRTETKQRNADVYVFCLLSEKDQSKFDPTNLSQWQFYVVATRDLDERLGKQKQLSLRKLLRLNPVACKFGEMSDSIEKALASSD